MIGTLPWMAELTNQPNRFLRVLTFTVTLIIDIILVMVPVIAWYTQSPTVFIGLILFLAGILVMSYRFGISNTQQVVSRTIVKSTSYIQALSEVFKRNLFL